MEAAVSLERDRERFLLNLFCSLFADASPTSTSPLLAVVDGFHICLISLYFFFRRFYVNCCCSSRPAKQRSRKALKVIAIIHFKCKCCTASRISHKSGAGTGSINGNRQENGKLVALALTFCARVCLRVQTFIEECVCVCARLGAFGLVRSLVLSLFGIKFKLSRLQHLSTADRTHTDRQTVRQTGLQSIKLPSGSLFTAIYTQLTLPQWGWWRIQRKLHIVYASKRLSAIK